MDLMAEVPLVHLLGVGPAPQDRVQWEDNDSGVNKGDYDSGVNRGG